MSEREIDQQLVNQAAKGDREAFDILVLKYQNRIAGVVARMLDDPSAVNDITQETFIKAYRALGTFQGKSSFFTWIYRIAINTVKNYHKHLKTLPMEVEVDYVDSEYKPGRIKLRDQATPEGLTACNEVEAALLDAVNHLPSELRLSIILREMAGLSYDEIATVMQCPVGTVRSRIFRARSAVDKQLRPFLS
jgi:RNA polymerase sigma-70 factor, ECF subfamily